jgi:hypothetical protein
VRLPLLVLHITAGTLGMLSGFVAIFLRKGSRQHGLAGSVFVIPVGGPSGRWKMGLARAIKRLVLSWFVQVVGTLPQPLSPLQTDVPSATQVRSLGCWSYALGALFSQLRWATSPIGAPSGS